METTEHVEIPKCEICNSRYSARMTIGRKKVCFEILKQKISNLGWRGLVHSIFYLVGALLSLYVFIVGCVYSVSGILTFFKV